MSDYLESEWHAEKQTPRQKWTSIGGPVATVTGEKDGGRKVKFVIGAGSDWGPVDECEAGKIARLIAAAPELLEACKMALQFPGDANTNGSPKTRRYLLDAIAKAEGADATAD